jgi:uncharacterized alpha-E superfamily protein
VLSRIADSLYWMSRYLERAGDTARLIEINLLHLVEAEDALPEAAQWKTLLSITSSEELFAQCTGGAAITAQRVIEFLTLERSNANAIRTSLRMSRENARVVRDRISKEMWEALNELWFQLERSLSLPLLPERAAPVYADVRNGVARFHGITSTTMMRGQAWGFYLLGTFLERSDMTARILDVKYHLLLPDLSMVGSPLDYYQWAALLKSISGFEAFRRKYHEGLRPLDVGEFVIFERDFPRSLRFSVDRMRNALQTVGDDDPHSASHGIIARLAERLEHSSAEHVFEQGLHEFLEEFLQEIADLNTALQADYFEARFTDPDHPCGT